MSLIGILWAIVVALLIFWVVGLLLEIGGAFINIVLVVALILLVYSLFTGRRVI